MNELRTQAVLAAACKDQGGYGIKLQNKFLAGIPDLFLALPGVGMAFVEVKLRGGQLAKIQQVTIERMQGAGVPAGWCVVQHVGGGAASIWAGTSASGVNIAGTPLLKVRGGEWPIADIIRMCQPDA